MIIYRASDTRKPLLQRRQQHARKDLIMTVLYASDAQYTIDKNQGTISLM